HLAALVPMGNMLVLDTLRFGYEVRPASEFRVPAGTPKALNIHEKELSMALKLMDEMTDEWDPDTYHDTYRDDLLARVKEKVKAGETEEITEPEEPAQAPRKAEVIDLMALLKNSIDRKKGKGAVESGGARRAARSARRAP